MSLTRLRFDNTYRTLPKSLYAEVEPAPFAHPETVAISADCLSLLDLTTDNVPDHELREFFSGRALLPGSQPIAQKYTGHQFGAYNPDLGDGRGLLLGEVVNQQGEKWDLHLKGAGKTPFSRMGDGRAVLRSCIREFLASEALHHLGIPTTRALCVIGSDEPVYRETRETGAMLLRVARTHIRFGQFEYLFHTQQHDLLNTFLDYAIGQTLPCLLDRPDRAREYFRHVVQSTARLIAGWQAYGFNHGVMNTDNMSIRGDTFDFGPYAFLDDFDPGFICNHSDWSGRYAFNQQPQIGLWNLNALAMTFSHHLSRDDLVSALKEYEPAFQHHWLELMRGRLGLSTEDNQDEALIEDLLTLMAHNHSDYTNTLRALCEFDSQTAETPARDYFADRDSFDRWARRYAERLRHQPENDAARRENMLARNPKYILRNYLAQRAIERAEKGDFSEVRQLHQLLTRPFDEQPDFSDYAALPPDWGKHLEISCSS